MNLNYCPVPGASQPRGMRFDTENSRCIPAERMTPDELRQLHRLAIERRWGSLPATDKQMQLIQKRCKGRFEVPEKMTKMQASQVLTRLLNGGAAYGRS